MKHVTRKEVVEYVAPQVVTSQQALADIDVGSYPKPHRFTVDCLPLWNPDVETYSNFSDCVLVTVTLYWLSDG